MCECELPLVLFQVEFRVSVYPTSRESRWCPDDYPTSHSLCTIPTQVSQNWNGHGHTLSGHSGQVWEQVWELLLVLLPPHERTTVALTHKFPQQRPQVLVILFSYFIFNLCVYY